MKLKKILETKKTVDINEGDDTKYTWGQINKAFMAQGTTPKQILRFLSVLKKQK